MSTWIDRIRTHPLWQHLEALGPLIDQASAREGADAAMLDGLNRMKAVLAFVGQRLAGADPHLLQTPPLDNLSTHIQNATTEVRNFITNGNLGHITNANAHGDSALTTLAQLNVPIVTTDLAPLREAAENYRTVIERNLQSLESSFVKTGSDLEGLHKRLS